jgi:hypothetical protein
MKRRVIAQAPNSCVALSGAALDGLQGGVVIIESARMTPDPGSKKLFKFINSWTESWGDKGYGYLPYDYIARNSVDVWSLTM